MFWLTKSFVEEVRRNRFFWCRYLVEGTSHAVYDECDCLIDDKENRQIWFMCVCNVILRDTTYLTEKSLKKLCPHGGLIGCGDSFLEDYLKGSKLLRVHAAFHDAFGFCKSYCNKGPGYSYVIPFLWNSCLIGHISGLTYWWIFSKIYPSLYNDLLEFL